VKKLRVALIGYGYWGPNLARNVALNSKYDLVAIVDQDKQRRQMAASLYGIDTFASYLDLDKDLKIDLAVVCTRPASHKSLVTHFIKTKTHILVTKPCGISSTEAREMTMLADEFNVKVFCDFTYHFSPLIDFLFVNPIANKIIEQMREYTSYRTSLGIIQADVDVLADLAVHDINILLLLKSSLPVSVNCIKTNSTDSPLLQAAFLTLIWADGFAASIHVSWNSPRKVRLISIASKDHAILLEEMNREAPIQIVRFEPSDSCYESLTPEEKYSRNVSFTMGNLEVPQIDMYEALAKEVDAIADALTMNSVERSIPSSINAADAWKIIEALRESNRLGGIAQNVH
jgi:predicted dehydrogenase